MKTRIIKLMAVYLVLFLSIIAPAQTGGTFEITQSVIAGGGGQQSAGGTFSIDGTIGQPLAGNGLIGSPFSVTSGFWNDTPSAPNSQTYEADVAPRPNGNNGLIEPADVIQVQRFQIGLDQADLSNEFQRADSAPFSSRGDGFIQPNDVVQAQRYQIGLDLQQFAAGPSAPPPAPASAPLADTAFGAVRVDAKKSVAAPRELRVESPAGSFSGGQQVVVNIRVDAIGDESAYGFTLDYSPAALMSPTVAIGTAGGSRFCNTLVAGQIRCSINNFPDNNPASDTDQIGEIAAGNNQLLVRITFTVVSNAPGGATPLTLSNLGASNDLAQSLTPITATNGTVEILGPTAAAATISGRVLTAQGRGITNSIISLTNPATGEVLVARSRAFGYYSFKNAAVGQTYILTITSKRFVFNPNSLVINLTGDLTNTDFIALP